MTQLGQELPQGQGRPGEDIGVVASFQVRQLILRALMPRLGQKLSNPYFQAAGGEGKEHGSLVPRHVMGDFAHEAAQGKLGLEEDGVQLVEDAYVISQRGSPALLFGLGVLDESVVEGPEFRFLRSDPSLVDGFDAFPELSFGNLIGKEESYLFSEFPCDGLADLEHSQGHDSLFAQSGSGQVQDGVLQLLLDSLDPLAAVTHPGHFGQDIPDMLFLPFRCA